MIRHTEMGPHSGYGAGIDWVVECLKVLYLQCLDSGVFLVQGLPQPLPVLLKHDEGQ